MFSDKLENDVKEPNLTTLHEIYTNRPEDSSKCYDNGHNQWTSWRSVQNPTENNGDDYETLYDHIYKFG